MCSNQLNLFENLDNFSLDYIKSYSLRPETWKSTTQIKHVPKQEIKVIGDKTGHRNVLNIKNNPKKIGQLKEIVGVPFKWIHVVRNPFDNLATWAKLNFQNKRDNVNQTKELNDVILKYRDLNETIVKLKRSEDILVVNHEFVITQMHNTLEKISQFLDISFDPIWRDNVRKAVWKKPRVTRKTIKWTQQQKKIVQDMCDKYEWLKGYDYGMCGRC